MTVIAYRDGIIACDSLINDDGIKCGYARKIVAVPGDGVAAACNDLPGIHAFLDWASKGFKKKSRPIMGSNQISGAHVTAAGVAWFYDANLMPYLCETPFFSLGSGSDIAVGAMAAGAPAIEAVRIAIAYCGTCGGPIKALTLAGTEIEAD